MLRTIVTAVLVLAASSTAHAQTPEPTRLVCPAGKTCKVVASSAASPEVDRICMKEIARPGKVPATEPLACGKPVAGKVTVSLTNTTGRHIEFAAYSIDDDFKIESEGSVVRGLLVAPLPQPVLEEIAVEVAAAAENARDAVAHADRAQKLLQIVLAGEED